MVKWLSSTYISIFHCLTFIKHNTIQVHPCCCKDCNFISFYVWVAFHFVCVWSHPLYPFICWWRHLHCLHILTIVNNAAVNIGVCVSFIISVLIFFGCIPRSGITGSYRFLLVVVVWGTPMLFSMVSESIHIPSNTVRGLPVFHILTNICCLFSFWSWPFWQVRGDILLRFWFAFSWRLETVFSPLYIPASFVRHWLTIRAWIYFRVLSFSFFPLIPVCFCVSTIQFDYCSFVAQEVYFQFQFSHSVISDSLWPHDPEHARLPCPSPTSGVHPNSCSWNRWCHPTISSTVVPFSVCPQSFPASGSFPMSQLFASGAQSIGVSASASVLPMNIQDWSPLGWVGWISLQSKGLTRVFSNTTVQKHQFFGAQLSL